MTNRKIPNEIQNRIITDIGTVSEKLAMIQKELSKKYSCHSVTLQLLKQSLKNIIALRLSLNNLFEIE